MTRRNTYRCIQGFSLEDSTQNRVLEFGKICQERLFPEALDVEPFHELTILERHLDSADGLCQVELTCSDSSIIAHSPSPRMPSWPSSSALLSLISSSVMSKRWQSTDS